MKYAKLAISIILVGAIVWSVDPDKLLTAFESARPGPIAAALAFQVGAILVAAFRYRIIGQRLGFGKDLAFYCKSYFKGMLFNQALPTNIGGDALRVMDLNKTGNGTAQSVMCILCDRLLGLLGLTVLVLAAALTQPRTLPPALQYGMILLAGGYIFGFVALFFMGKIAFFKQFEILKHARALSDDMRKTIGVFSDAALQLALTLTIQTLSVAAVYQLGLSVNLLYPFTIYLLMVPMVFLLSIIPISFAGWGIRETSLVALFAMVGADESKVLFVSVMYGIVLIAASLPGLPIYLSGKHRYL